jgi:hypothetical protein
MYKNLTLKKLRKEISAFFHGKQKSVLTYPELKAKILSGYFYSIDTGPSSVTGRRAIKVHTGIGGIISYIDACEQMEGMTAEDVARSIICHTSKGDFNMLQVKIKSKH